MREKNPFNDVTDYYSKHVRLPTEKVEMKKIPRPLRFIGYFLVGGWRLRRLFILSGL